MTIEQAIKNCDDEIWGISDESINQHHEIGKWLSELQSYKDNTYITAEWLVKNGFEFKIGCKDDPDYYLYCDDVVEITAILRNEEAGIWEICIQFLDHGDTEVLNICTVGELRMFLAIEGLENIAKQLK